MEDTRAATLLYLEAQRQRLLGFPVKVRRGEAAVATGLPPPDAHPQRVPAPATPKRIQPARCVHLSEDNALRSSPVVRIVAAPHVVYPTLLVQDRISQRHSFEVTCTLRRSCVCITVPLWTDFRGAAILGYRVDIFSPQTGPPLQSALESFIMMDIIMTGYTLYVPTTSCGSCSPVSVALSL